MGTILKGFTPNEVAALAANQKNQKPQKNSSFDERNYLDTHIDEGQTERSTTIRLIPFVNEDGTTSPFAVAHYHTIRVPEEISKSGWKSYLCNRKTKDIDHDRYGYDCPLCEINKHAYDASLTETDPQRKKALQETSCAARAKEAHIYKLIERGKESDGVKFWKINLRTNDGADASNAIQKIFSDLYTKAANRGKTDDIYNVYEGRDLTITFHAGTAPTTVTYDVEKTPLSNDEAQISEWVYNSKRWQEVFTPKDYDYIAIVAQGKTPWFDKESQRWVDKAAVDAEKDKAEAKVVNEIETAEKKLMYQPQTTSAATVIPSSQPVVGTTPTPPVSTACVDEDEDLPF